MEFISDSPQSTQNFAKQFVQRLQPNSIISFTGDLGTGKTQFIKGICNFFDIPEDEVISPTFVLRRDYKTDKINIYHFDFYRFLDEPLDEERKKEILSSIGFYDVVNNGYILVEWGESFSKEIAFTKYINIKYLEGNKRLISISDYENFSS